MPVRVLVADDHDLVRKGIVHLLGEAEGIEVVAEASSGEATLDALERLVPPPDVCLLDVAMPGMGGIEALHEIVARHPGTSVVVVSMYDERDYGLRCIAEGASGYLTKGHPPEELVEAILTVAGGRRYLTPELAEVLADRMSAGEPRPPHDDLSPREFEVFRRLAGGSSVTEIGRDLCISVKTVSTYRARVLTKLRLTRNAELTAYAIRNGIALVGMGGPTLAEDEAGSVPPEPSDS